MSPIREGILFAFVSTCIVDKDLNTLNLGSMWLKMPLHVAVYQVIWDLPQGHNRNIVLRGQSYFS